MLDELRDQASSEEIFTEEAPRVERAPYRERRFLGMTASQRLVISVLFFMIVCILGVFFLVVSQKIVPGFLPF